MRCAAPRSVALALLLSAGACEKKAPATKAPEAPPEVFIHDAKAKVMTSDVGLEPHRMKATYVLVDVENKGDKDALITVGGSLLDDAGKTVSELRMQSLRVPSKGRRLFAVLDSENKERPNAKTAKLKVLEAMISEHPAEIIVIDGKVDADQNRAVVRGKIKNLAKRHAKAVVIAGFYNEAGEPMDRPATLFDLTAGGERGVQFAGPPGSKSATLFIGEVRF